MPKKVFIGVAWPYVNGNLHIGHLAGYLLPADIFARFHRMIGSSVLMVSGSDCYGTPITIEADKRNLPPAKIVEEYHKKNLDLFGHLNISFDLYTKTTTENHHKVAQNMFLALLQKGYVFKNKSEQYYSEEKNRFLPDRYVEGECPYCQNLESKSDQCDNCGTVLETGELINPKSKLTNASLTLKPTEHYFLNWPKLEPFLKKYVKEKGAHWREWVRRETEGWLETGLKPRAITRDLDWGIPLPHKDIPPELQLENAPHKRLYVWFEAVIGYLSASIEWSEDHKWHDFWKDPEAQHYYFMGKDNLVFHTLFWPGQLHAYDGKLKTPDVVAINQFLQLEGKKFSKSKGVIIDSREITEKYGNDPIRFYLSLIMPEEADASFSMADFIEANNKILIGTLGNFINRTLTLAESTTHTAPIARKVKKQVEETMGNAHTALSQTEFKKYAHEVLALADFGNKYLAEEAPWQNRSGSQKFKKATTSAAYIVVALHAMMKPLLPQAHEALSQILGTTCPHWPSESDLETQLKKIKISGIKPLFKKIEA